MKKLHFLALFILFTLSSFKINKTESILKLNIEQKEVKFNQYINSIYSCLNDSSLSKEAFLYAMKGYYSIESTKNINQDLLIVVDFTMPSFKQRFFVIDLFKEEIVYKKLVAHGKNTGEIFAEKFSNRENSRMSSIGFYLTGYTYDGKYDNSLKIEGLEYTNSNAMERGVVIHAADYATPDFLKQNGMLGRSYGCPALPYEDYEDIVDLIKEGTVMFIYYNDTSYLKKSDYLKKKRYLQNFA